MPGRIRVTVEKNGKSLIRILKDGSTAEYLLELLDLLPDAHIVVRGKIPIPITEVLVDGDRIRVIRVASGG